MASAIDSESASVPLAPALRRMAATVSVPRLREGLCATADGRRLKPERFERGGVELAGISVTIREEDQRSDGLLAWATAFHNGSRVLGDRVLDRNYSLVQAPVCRVSNGR